MDGANLKYTKFRGANLQKAKFNGSVLSFTDFLEVVRSL